MSENGGIYTAGKNFTLPLAVTALTNFNSAGRAALIVVSWDPGWEETILNEVSLRGSPTISATPVYWSPYPSPLKSA